MVKTHKFKCFTRHKPALPSWLVSSCNLETKPLKYIRCFYYCLYDIEQLQCVKSFAFNSSAGRMAASKTRLVGHASRTMDDEAS